MKLVGVLGTLGLWVAIGIPVLIIYREAEESPEREGGVTCPQ